MLDSRQVVPNGPGKTSKGLSRNPKGHSKFASESWDDDLDLLSHLVEQLERQAVVESARSVDRFLRHLANGPISEFYTVILEQLLSTCHGRPRRRRLE